MKYYTQLTQEQRYQIYAMNKAGFSQTEIAKEIEVHKSTISRELSRNSGLRGYRPKQAHEFALSRRDKAVVRILPSHWQQNFKAKVLDIAVILIFRGEASEVKAAQH